VSRDDFYKAYDDIMTIYKDVPYHSRFHGNDVMLSAYALLKNSSIFEYLNRYELLTFLFGMLGHDAGHPGLANKMELVSIREKFPMATSPLEEYHYSLVSGILQRHHLGHYDDLLRTIILATDPFLPVEMAQRGLSENIKGIVILIKMADVNHAFSSFHKHLEWTWKLQDELGIKLTPKSQLHFLMSHLYPLVESSQIILNRDIYLQCKRNLQDNIEFWDRRTVGR
jgi:hypothetical protein